MHEVLVNRLGGLSLLRKSVVRLTDRPDMTLDVYRGRKTTMQQQQFIHQVAIKFRFRKALQKKCFQSDIIFRHYVKMPSINLKGRISVKINLIAIKITHAHLYYVHKNYSRFQKDSLEIVGEVNYTNSISYNAKPK